MESNDGRQEVQQYLLPGGICAKAPLPSTASKTHLVNALTSYAPLYIYPQPPSPTIVMERRLPL